MFIPTLLGVDLASYSLATSMHECFGIKSHAFGRYRCGVSFYSSIMKTHTHENLLDEGVAKDVLISFAKMQTKPCILIPTTDWYVDLAVRLRESLSPYYKIAIPEPSLFFDLSNKESFYRILDTYGINHPETLAFFIGEKPLWNTFPCVLKPASSIEAQRRAFSGQKKVYVINNAEELATTLGTLTFHQKGMRYLLQPYLLAERSYVLTVFSQKNFGCRVASLAEVAVEEVGDSARGNYSALLVRELNETARQIISFCDAIGYEGVANFDIIRHKNEDYILEMNLRVGRSSDYLRAAGHSVADFLFKSQNCASAYPEKFLSVPIYWRCIYDREVLLLAREDLRDEIKEKLKCGFSSSPYDYRAHFFHPLEWLYRNVHMHRASRATALAYRK